jgi:hypothetical protein
MASLSAVTVDAPLASGKPNMLQKTTLQESITLSAWHPTTPTPMTNNKIHKNNFKNAKRKCSCLSASKRLPLANLRV